MNYFGLLSFERYHNTRHTIIVSHITNKETAIISEGKEAQNMLSNKNVNDWIEDKISSSFQLINESNLITKLSVCPLY